MKLSACTSIIVLTTAVTAGYVTVPPAPASGPSSVEWTAGKAGFDAPKVVPINGSTFDWWYFDVVSNPSTGSNFTSIQVVLYTSTPNGFVALQGLPIENPSVNIVQVTGLFENGTAFDIYLNETETHFLTVGDGTSAVYDTGEVFLYGKPDLSQYFLKIDAPEKGVSETLHLKSVSPPHAVCGPASPDANLQMGPHIGWANSIPGAEATVAFEIQGEKLGMTGLGYHDKNWGDQPFANNVENWYWGHAQVGEYVVVWLDMHHTNGEHYVSSFVAKDGKIITAQCSGIRVRPIGPGTSYPPRISDSPPEGFSLKVQIPRGKLRLTVQVDNTVLGQKGGAYFRWVGRVRGGLQGQKEETGVALFEQFAFI